MHLQTTWYDHNYLGLVSASVSKQVLKNNGTIKLTMRDIFYTQAMAGLTKFELADEYFKINGIAVYAVFHSVTVLEKLQSHCRRGLVGRAMKYKEWGARKYYCYKLQVTG